MEDATNTKPQFRILNAEESQAFDRIITEVKRLEKLAEQQPLHRYVTSTHICEYFGWNIKYLQRLHNSGELKYAAKRHKEFVYLADEFEAWLVNQKQVEVVSTKKKSLRALQGMVKRNF